MAKYPIKMLKDEENNPFIPLVSTEGIQSPDGETLEQKLQKKLEKENIIAGSNITINTEGNNITINSTGGSASANLIDNLTTEIAGQGALDARQGKILKDSIPQVINNLTTVDTNNALSAYQGYLLDHKFNDYALKTSVPTKTSQIINDSDYITSNELPQDTGWIEVTEFYGGAGNFNSSYPVCYRKIGNTVYLNGLMRGGSPGIQFILPPGYRPRGVYNAFICRFGTGWGRVFINYDQQNGEVYCEADPTSPQDIEIPLSNISFLADN